MVEMDPPAAEKLNLNSGDPWHLTADLGASPIDDGVSTSPKRWINTPPGPRPGHCLSFELAAPVNKVFQCEAVAVAILRLRQIALFPTRRVSAPETTGSLSLVRSQSQFFTQAFPVDD